jgi:hypothetical protein
MCCSTAAFTQIKYDVVNAYAVQHHFVGYNRHTVKTSKYNKYFTDYYKDLKKLNPQKYSDIK